MSITTQQLSDARKEGYSDEEIYNHLIQSNNQFEEVKTQGYSLDELASHYDQTKGGGKQNVQNQTGANSDRNAEREANQQVGNLNEANNASGEEPQLLQNGGVQYPSEDGSQKTEAELKVQPTFETGGDSVEEAKRKQAAYRQKGEEGRQAIPVEDDAWNQAKLNVDAFPTQTIGEKFGEGMKQAPPERGLAELGLAGFNEKAYKYASAAVGAMSITPKGMAAATEAVFGKNKYSDKLRSAPNEVQSYLSGLAKHYGLNETENKSMLDGLVHGTAGGLVDLAAIPLTEGAGLIAEAPIADASSNVLKAIYDKSVHGIQAFSIPSAVAMDSAIKESKAKGASDHEALADGVKTLISTEAGAALPLQVSSGLSNMIARGASRVLQSVPLVLAQQEIGQTIENMMAKEGEKTPTFSQNVISGNFKDAERQLVNSAPMALLGAAGENTYRKGPQIVGKEELAKIHESFLSQTANEIQSQQAEEIKKETTKQGKTINIPAATPEELAQVGETPATELPTAAQPPSTPIEAAMQMGLSDSDAQSYVENLKQQGIPDDQIIQLAVDQKTGNEQIALADRARKGDVDAVNELRKQRGLKPKQGQQSEPPTETETTTAGEGKEEVKPAKLKILDLSESKAKSLSERAQEVANWYARHFVNHENGHYDINGERSKLADFDSWVNEGGPDVPYVLTKQIKSKAKKLIEDEVNNLRRFSINKAKKAEVEISEAPQTTEPTSTTEPTPAEEVDHDQAREQTPVLQDHKIKQVVIDAPQADGTTKRKVVHKVVEIWKDANGNIIEGQSFGENLTKADAVKMRVQLNKESDIVKKGPQKGEGTWGLHPIIEYLIQNPIRSRTEAIKEAKRRGQPLEASYDPEEIPTLADMRHNNIYGGNQSIDSALGDIVDNNWMPPDSKTSDLWQFIQNQSESSDRFRKQEAFQKKKWEAEAKKAAAEERKAAKAGNATPTPESLEQKADAYIKQSSREGRIYTANPALVVAMMYKAAASIARGTIKFAPWAAKMLQERGKAVREVLHEAWVKGKILHEELFQRKLSEESKKTAARFVESPKGTRVMSAAYRDPDTGIIHEGQDHETAMTNAGKTPITDPANRETDDFGFMTDKGEFISRDKAREVGEKAKQVYPTSVSGMKKLHSTDINLSAYNSKGERVVDPLLFSERPKAAVAQQLNLSLEKFIKDSNVLREIRDGLSGRIPNMSVKAHTELLNVMRKMELTHDDFETLGIKMPKSRAIDVLLNSTKNSTYQFTDFIGNKIVPNLSRVGLLPNAYELAYSRASIRREVDSLISQVFKDDYHNTEKMKQTMKVIVDDNILGGYDEATKQLKRIQDLIESNKDTATKADVSSLRGQETNMKKFIAEIERVRNINELNASVEAAKLNPEIIANIERWKQFVTPRMEELYRTMKGIKKDQKINEDLVEETRGRYFGARINLLPESKIESVVDYFDPTKAMPELDITDFKAPERASYRNPDVKMDKFLNRAKFNDDYSVDPTLILANTLGTRHHEASKINLYDALVKNGVAYLVPAGEEGPKTINGKPVQIREIKYPVFDNETGKTTMRTFNLHVQNNLSSELNSVLAVNEKTKSNPFLTAFTGVQMIGIADATAHLKNLHAVVATSLGRDSVWKDIFAKMPFVGSSQSINEIIKVCKELALDTPEIRKELAELAKQGLIRQTMESEGIQKILGMHDLIHDVDTAARVIMSRRYKNLVKNWDAVDTIEGKIQFVNQLGEYNRRLMGRLESGFRDSGLSPFIVAGRAMNRFARRSILGEYGFKTNTTKGALTARAAQMSGLVFASAIPMISNMFTTGTPYGRNGTPIGAIDLGPKWDTEDGKHRIFDVFQLVGIRRGLRQLGINAAIEGLRQGKDWAGITEDAKNDFFTTSAHAFVGPAVGAGLEALTGQRFDLRTGYGQSFSARKIEGAAGQYAENFRVALKHLNPMIYGLVQRPIQASQKSLFGTPKAADEDAPIQAVGAALFQSPEAAIGLNWRGIVSPAIKLANQMGEKQMYTPEQDIRYQARKNILDARERKDKDGAAQMYVQYKKDGILTEADDKAIKAQIKEPNRLIKKVKMLKTSEDAIKVFRVADGKEQDDILPSVLGKISRSTTMNDEEKINMAKSLRGYLKKDSQYYKK